MSCLDFVEEESDTEGLESEDETRAQFFIWRSKYYVPKAFNAPNTSCSRHQFSSGTLKNSTTNWIPPVNFKRKIRSRKGKEFKKSKNSEDSTQLSTLSGAANNLLSKNEEILPLHHPTITDRKIQGPSKQMSNEGLRANEVENDGNDGGSRDVIPKIPFTDWGNRLHYGTSFFNIDNGELVWDLLEPGHFGIMRLRKNGNSIEAFAEAEIHNKSWTEHAVVIINQEHHLRMLLNVARDEWCALMEMLGDNPWILGHHALTKNRPLTAMTTAEKLWFFLCKRRHHLPLLALQLKRAGIKKLPMKILPKFIVCQIRSYSGDAIT